MESWKVNLISVWFGCFFTGLAISQILPFLPLYVSQLGVTSHEALSMWSGLTFSVTFLVSAIVSPMWGSLADRKGRKLMLLRASLGMAIAILLQAFATNVWQLFILRAIMGLTSGYIPNAMALVASQVPRERSGWALSTLSTAQISGVIGGPLLGGFLADHVGLRMVFFITAILLTISFLVTLFLIKEGVRPQVSKSDRLTGKQDPAGDHGLNLRLYSQRHGAGGLPGAARAQRLGAQYAIDGANQRSYRRAAAGRLSGRPCWAAGGLFYHRDSADGQFSRHAISD